MVAKELDKGMAAYNIVRALIGLASQQSGTPPRGYSFTKVRRIVETFAPALANPPSTGRKAYLRSNDEIHSTGQTPTVSTQRRSLSQGSVEDDRYLPRGTGARAASARGRLENLRSSASICWWRWSVPRHSPLHDRHIPQVPVQLIVIEPEPHHEPVGDLEAPVPHRDLHDAPRVSIQKRADVERVR